MYYTVPLVGIFDLCQGLRLHLHWWDQKPAYDDAYMYTRRPANESKILNIMLPNHPLYMHIYMYLLMYAKSLVYKLNTINRSRSHTNLDTIIYALVTISSIHACESAHLWQWFHCL